jgi:hypothetical protein
LWVSAQYCRLRDWFTSNFSTSESFVDGFHDPLLDKPRALADEVGTSASVRMADLTTPVAAGKDHGLSTKVPSAARPKSMPPPLPSERAQRGNSGSSGPLPPPPNPAPARRKTTPPPLPSKRSTRE